MSEDKQAYRVDAVDSETHREEIFSIWRNVGTDLADSGKLDNFYLTNPAGKPRVFLLWSEAEQRHVGMLFAVPRDIVFDSTPLKGMLFTDLFVEPAHRSLGPSLLLQRFAREHVLEDHDLAYGFMNKMGALVGRRAGYTIRSNCTQMVFPLSLNFYIKKHLAGPAGRILATISHPLWAMKIRVLAWSPRKRGSFRYSSKAPNAEFHRDNLVYGRRDSNFLSWRLSKAPEGSESFLSFEDKDGCCQGFIGYRQDSGRVYTQDVFANNKRVFKAMIRGFLDDMRKQGQLSVWITVLEDTSEFRWLKSMLFRATEPTPVFWDWATRHEDTYGNLPVFLTRADNDC